MAQLAAVVALTTCTVSLALAARTRLPQVRIWWLATHVIEQLIGPLVPVVAIDQWIPGPLGSGSVRMGTTARPVPALCSVIVKPIGEPAFTEVASAVLVIVRFGRHFTSSEAWAEPETGRLLPLA